MVPVRGTTYQALDIAVAGDPEARPNGASRGLASWVGFAFALGLSNWAGMGQLTGRDAFSHPRLVRLIGRRP